MLSHPYQTEISFNRIQSRLESLLSALGAMESMRIFQSIPPTREAAWS